jgi:hypothetical protein
MKHLTAYHLIALTCLILLGFTLAPWVQADAATKPAGDTVVYHAEGKKRVHVEGCPRLPADRSGMKTMTLAEAEAKGLALCSRCPGSTTQRDAKPEDKPKKDKAAE